MGIKLTRYLVLICFIIAVLTFGSGDKYFYLFWSVAVLITFIYFYNMLSQGIVKKRYVQIFFLLFMWMIYAFIVSPWATNSDEHLKILSLSFLYTTFSIICAIIIGFKSERFIKFMEVAIMVWIFLNLSSLLLYFAGIIGYGFKSFSGVYYNRNTLATIGLLFLVFIVFLKNELIFLRTRGRSKFVLISLIVLIVSTESSKGFIGILFIGLTYVLTLKNLRRVLSVSIVLIGSFLILFLMLDLDVTLRAKKNISGFLGISQKIEPGSVTASGKERNFLMNQGLKVAMENPFTGVGVNNSKYHLFPYSYYKKLARGDDPGSGLISHNNYIEMLLNGGVPAFILYYMPILYIVLLLQKNRNDNMRKNNFRKFFLISIYLKLLMDVGMVSYMTFPYIFIIASSYVFYYNYLKQQNKDKELDNIKPNE